MFSDWVARLLFCAILNYDEYYLCNTTEYWNALLIKLFNFCRIMLTFYTIYFRINTSKDPFVFF